MRVGCFRRKSLDLLFERLDLFVQRLRFFGDGIVLLPKESHNAHLTAEKQGHDNRDEAERNRPGQREADTA